MQKIYSLSLLSDWVLDSWYSNMFLYLIVAFMTDLIYFIAIFDEVFKFDVIVSC